MSNSGWRIHPVAGTLTAVFLLLFGGGIIRNLEADSNPRLHRQIEDQRSSDERGGVGSQDPSRRFVEAPADPDADSDPNDGQYAARNDAREYAFIGDRLAQGWMTVLAGLGLVAAGLTVGLLWATLHETKKAAGFAADTFNQAKAQTALAQKQLNAAASAANEAQRVLRNQSRAYVHVSEAWIDMTEEIVGIELAAVTEPDEPLAPKFRPKLFLKVENVGQTATTFLAHITTVQQEPFGETLRVKPLEGHAIQHKISNLAPQSDRDVQAEPYALMERIAQHRKTPQKIPGRGLLRNVPDNFCVRGVIRYIDVFGKRFITEFGFFGSNPADGIVNRLTAMPAFFPIYEETNPDGSRKTDDVRIGVPPEPIPDDPLAPGASGQPKDE